MKRNKIYPYQADITLKSKGMVDIHVDIYHTSIEGNYFKLHIDGSIEPTLEVNESQLVQLLNACRTLKKLSKGVNISKR